MLLVRMWSTGRLWSFNTNDFSSATTTRIRFICNCKCCDKWWTGTHRTDNHCRDEGEWTTQFAGIKYQETAKIKFSKPHLSTRHLPLGQEGGKGALQHVRVSTNCMRSVAVVRALAVEAQVVGWRHEERLEQLILGHLVNLRRDI